MMGTKIHKFCHCCHRTHAFYNGKACEHTKVIKFDLADHSIKSATGLIDIAKQVASTESSELPKERIE